MDELEDIEELEEIEDLEEWRSGVRKPETYSLKPVTCDLRG